MTDEVARIAAAVDVVPFAETEDNFDAEGYRDAIVDSLVAAGLRLPDSRVDIAEPGLDAAWAEAEAALPDRWFVTSLQRVGLPGSIARWYARAELLGAPGSQQADGNSASEALRNLAARLRENRP